MACRRMLVSLGECSGAAIPGAASLAPYLAAGWEVGGGEVHARRLDRLEERWTVDGLPSRYATTSTRGRSGRSAGAGTTPAPTTAPHPAVAWPHRPEPSSMPAAHLGARSSHQARRHGPVRRQDAGHTMADARPCGSRVAGQLLLGGAIGGVRFPSLHHRPGHPIRRGLMPPLRSVVWTPGILRARGGAAFVGLL
jgi:hypothetical protein